MEHAHHPLTSAHLEPWLGNVVDLTMIDGTYRVSLLKKVDAHWAQLRRTPASAPLLNDGTVRIECAVSITRASRK